MRFKSWARERTADGRGYCELLLDVARFHETDPAFIRFFIVLSAESLEPSHPAHEWFRERYDRTRELFAGWIADDQRRGLVRADVDPMLASRTIVAALDGLELQYLLAGGGAQHLRAARALRRPAALAVEQVEKLAQRRDDVERPAGQQELELGTVEHRHQQPAEHGDVDVRVQHPRALVGGQLPLPAGRTWS